MTIFIGQGLARKIPAFNEYAFWGVVFRPFSVEVFGVRFELGEALNFTLEAGLKITFGLREGNLMVPERATFLLVPGRFDHFSDFLTF
jgi:hypothetical protein